jgi:hypothetical protein
MSHLHVFHNVIVLQGNQSLPHINPPPQPVDFSYIHPATVEEVSKLLFQSPVTDCGLNPIFASLF